MSKRTRRILIACGAVVLLVAPCAGWYLIVRLPDDQRAARLSAQLDRDIVAYRGYWSAKRRPILRGEPREGEAPEEALQIAARMALPELPVDVPNRLACGEQLEEVARLLEQHEADLADLRDTARVPTAWTELAIERGGGQVPVPSYLPLLRAETLLAAQASLAEPGECLAMVADGIRVAQDVAPGGGILGTAIAGAMLRDLSDAGLICLGRASPTERADAARAFELLATTAPAVGSAVELETLLSAATFRLSADAPLIPTTAEGLEQVRHRGIVLDAWEQVARDPARFRVMTPARYPEAVAIWDREQAARMSSGNPLLTIAAPTSITDYIERDMEAQAKLRALAVLAHGLSGTDPEGPPPTEAPDRASRPALADPFTGDPLRWSIPEGGHAVCACSVGPDRTDDGCHPDVDVVLCVTAGS